MTSDINNLRDEAGNLPAYAWPGGYPIVYYTEDGGAFCQKCANEEPQCSDLDSGDDWFIINADIHYEGLPIFCDNCDAAIESAYGDPDEEVEQ